MTDQCLSNWGRGRQEGMSRQDHKRNKLIHMSKYIKLHALNMYSLHKCFKYVQYIMSIIPKSYRFLKYFKQHIFNNIT